MDSSNSESFLPSEVMDKADDPNESDDEDTFATDGADEDAQPVVSPVTDGAARQGSSEQVYYFFIILVCQRESFLL